jgi:hypothetical protein
LKAPKPDGVTALSAFFGAGAPLSSAAALGLAFPGSFLEPMWRLNPEARVGFARLRSWAVVLMVSVALACGGAAGGLWAGRRWGYRLAVGVL